MMAQTAQILSIAPESLTFDDFWLLYPKRVAKKDAMRAWSKLKPDQQMKAATALMDWRTVWMQRGELQFIPHAATWLNGERFDDELPQDFVRIAPVAHQAFKQAEEKVERAPMPDKLRAMLAQLKRNG